MISPQTMTAVTEWVQILAVPVALFGLIRGIYEIAANRKQRVDELRWKQAQSAKELLDDIHNHELAKQAIHMLDWVDGSSEYKIRDGLSVVINYADVLNALAMNHGEACNESQQYIRDCFDWFFYRVDRIEHYIRRGLIKFEDVREVFKVYAREVGFHEDVFEDFLKFHEYTLAQQFFARYAKQP